MAPPRSALPGAPRALPWLLLLLLALELLACPPALGSSLRSLTREHYLARRAEYESASNSVAPQADPRPSLRQGFTKLNNQLGGPMKSSATNVVLLLVGDQFDPCTRLVLEDVFVMLDGHSNWRSKPAFLKDIADTKYKGSACAPTLNTWWAAVQTYKRTVKGKKEQVTGDFNFYGTYTYSAYDVNKKFNADVLNSLKQRMINPVISQGFKKVTDFKNFIIVTLLGSGVEFSPFEKSKYQKCAMGFFSSKEFFPGFYGGLVVPSSTSSHFSSDCKIQPQLKKNGFTLTTSNNCPQADYATSHILARMADLHVNPSQFKYVAKKAPMTSDSSNPPTWVCSKALTGKKYKKNVEVPCSAGSVCDLSYMSKAEIKITTKGSYYYADLKSAPAVSPEQTSWKPANWGILFRLNTAKQSISFYNTVSYKYLHYIQPYRTGDGKCAMANQGIPLTC